jgi:hypothetical protein
MRQRLAAWAVTGPLGHLAAGVADWATLVGGELARRYRGRHASAGSGDAAPGEHASSSRPT